MGGDRGADLPLELGDHDSGRRCFERSLALTIELNFAWGIAFSLEGLARLAVEERQPRGALVLAGAAGAPAPHRGDSAARRRPGADGRPARAREALPEADVTAAFAHGQRLDDGALIAWLRTERVLPS